MLSNEEKHRKLTQRLNKVINKIDMLEAKQMKLDIQRNKLQDRHDYLEHQLYVLRTTRED